MVESVEQFLGPAAQYKDPPKPEDSVEGFLGPRQFYEAENLSGSAWDEFFKRDTAPGHLMDRFNRGYEQAFGKEPLGLDRIKIGPPPEAGQLDTRKTATQLGREVGLFPDVQENGWFPWVKQFNESLLRGTVALADYGMRAAYATARGAAETAGAPGLTAKIVAPIGAAGAAAFEAFPAGHFTAFPAAEGSLLYPRNITAMMDLAEAESIHPKVNQVIESLSAEQSARGGNGIVLEAQPQPPDPIQVGRDQLANQIADKMAQASALREEGRQYGAVPDDAVRLEAEVRRLQERLDGLPERPPTDRVPAPETLELDELREQRLQLSSWLRDTIEDPVSFRIAGVEVPGTTPLGELPTVVARTEEAPTGQQAAQASIAEQLRQGIADIDRRIDEILPEVREAAKAEGPAITYEFQQPIYADVGLPPEGEVPLPHGVTANPGGGFDIATTEGTLYAKSEAEAGRIATKYETLTQRRSTIAQDVYRDLREAGQPDALSRANAAVVQAYYEARAARFEGKLGSARELYDADAPNIQGAAGRNRGAYSVAKRAITLFKDADASTFLHESAHNWFEDLLADAKRSDVPPDLIEDLNAVKAWLQMTGDRPTRAQHEKFARGFERYLMEGVAPSPKLATTFEKFRDWLVKLYQTVSRLKAPITDEIRAVYDRLLSTPRNSAIIGPERDLRGSFADAHEADVRSTPPEKALAKAEAIRAERDDIATLIRQEINLGRQRARAAARATRGASEGGEGGATVPEPTARKLPAEPTGTGIGTEAEAVGAERVASPAEGQAITRPDQIAEPAGTTVVDKAGNIRLKNLNAPEEVEQVLRDVAEANGNFGMERRGVVSDKEVLELATAMGLDPAFLDKKALGEAFNAEEIMAARVLLRKSEVDVRAAAKRLNETQDPNDALELAKLISQNRMIQGKVSQATAEWGRAGRAFRELRSFGDGEALAEFLKDNKGDFGNTYDQLLQMAQKLEILPEGGAVNKFARTTHGGRWPIVVYYLNSLLSGPITHSIYAIGNELRSIAKPLAYVPAQAAVGTVREALGATGDRVYWSEFMPAIYGMAKGHLEGWRAAKEAFRTGSQVTLPGMRGYAGNLLLTGMETTEGFTGTGAARFIGGVAEGDVRKAGQGLWQLYQLPYRSVASIHSFGATVGYYQNLFRFATRQALNEGLAGDALQKRIAGLTANPTDVLMKQAFNDRMEIMPDVPKPIKDWATIAQKASTEAMTEMYMRAYAYDSPAATTIRGLHSNPFTAMLVPFVKVGIEIQRENFVKHTPIGLASSEVRGQLMGREGGAAFDEAMGRQLVGMSLISGGALLSALGLMDDGGPADPQERQGWMLTHTPYSLSLGPVRVPLKGLPVLGSLLMFGADMYASGVHNWHKPEYNQLIENYFHSFAHAAFDEGFFRDLADIGEIIREPGRHLGKWLIDTATNFVPWNVGLGQVTRFGFDPYSKDVHGFDPVAIMDSFKRNIPFASYYVPDRIDLFGNPIKSRASWAVHHQDYLNDPVAQMLNRVHLGIGKLERTYEGVDLDTRTYEHYSVLAGRATYEMLKPFANNPGFARMPEGVQRLAIHNAILGAREMARAQLVAESMKNNPRDNLATKAATKKIEALK